MRAGDTGGNGGVGAGVVTVGAFGLGLGATGPEQALRRGTPRSAPQTGETRLTPASFRESLPIAVRWQPEDGGEYQVLPSTVSPEY